MAPSVKDFAIIIPELNTPNLERIQCGLQVLIWLEESQMKTIEAGSALQPFRRVEV